MNRLLNFVRAERGQNAHRTRFLFSLMLFGAILVLNSRVQATHLMGAEITYQQIATTPTCTTYRVFLAVYYDCTSSVPKVPGPGPALDLNNMFFTGGSGCPVPVPITPWTETSYTEVTPVCPGTPTRCTANNAAINGVVESRNFCDFQICNAAAGCQYTISWASVARNSTITSGAANDSLFVSTSLTTGQVNSSPRFTNIPVPYICAGQAFTFSQGADDADQDSLTYALVPCLQSATTPVGINGGFNSTNLALGSTWNVSINVTNGDITLTPNPGTPVTAVLCVEVTEFRNGVVIGRVRRDIQITIIPCPGGNTNPQILAATAHGATTTAVSNFEVSGTACSPIAFDISTTDPNTGQTFTMTWNQPASMPGATFQSVGLTPVQTNTITSGTPPTACFTWTPTQPGTYQFVVSLNDGACPIIGQNQRTFTVNVAPLWVGDFTAPTGPICTTSPVQLIYSGNTLPAGLSLLWVSPGGTFSPSPNVANPQVTWSSPGTKVCSLTVVSAAGCTSVVAVKNIDIIGPPAPTFTLNPNPVCLPTGDTSASATGTYTGGLTGLSYSWNMGGATVPNGTGPTKTATWNAAGSYQAILTVADATGCQNSDTLIQTVLAPAVVVSQSVAYTTLGTNTKATITITVQNTSLTSQSFDVTYQKPVGSTLMPGTTPGFITNGGVNTMIIAGSSSNSVVVVLQLPSCVFLNNCVTAKHTGLPLCENTSCISLFGGPAGSAVYGTYGGPPVLLSSLLVAGGIPYTVSGGIYYIYGQSLVFASSVKQDVYVDINACNITMAPGTQWEINNHIRAYQTTWKGCAAMWKGFVETGDRKIEFNDMNTIADAEIGLDMYALPATSPLPPTAIVQSKRYHGGVFRNCYIGVRYRGFPAKQAIGKLIVTYTVFTSTFFLDKYPGQLTAPDTRPLAAIWLENVSSYNLQGFRVERHNTGVCALNSSFDVSRTKQYSVQFDNIQPVSTYDPGTTATPTMTPMPLEAKGCAVYAEGGLRLSVTGNGGLASSLYTFQNCKYGVRTRNIPPTVQNCRMDWVTVPGVSISLTAGVDVTMLTMPGNGVIKVANNYIRTKGHGVRMFNTENTFFSIINNTIKVTPTSLTLGNPTIGCIDVSESGSPKSAKSLISGNILKDTLSYGIKLQNCQNKQVTLNTAALAGTNAQGIWLAGGSNNTVTGNTVTGNTTALANQRAYFFENSSGNNIRCNVANTTTYGYEFSGTCTAKDMFLSNTIGDAYIGLRLTPGTTTGTQGNTGTQDHAKNLWTGTYGLWGAQHMGNSLSWISSHFYCNNDPIFPGNPQYMPPVIPGSGPVQYKMTPQQGWIDYDFGGNTTDYCAGIAMGFAPGTLDSTYHLLAAGLLQPEIYPEEIRWAMAKDLFALIEADSLIAAGDSVVMAYYNTLKASTLGHLMGVVQQYGEVNDGAASDSVQALWNSINARALQIATLDSLVQADTTQAGSYTATLDSLYALQNSQMELLTQLSQAQAALWVNDLSVVEGNNNATSASEVYEVNWREVNRVYLAALRNGVVDPAETDLLQGIAAQCPLAGGPAVYAARTLYAHLTDDPGYDDYNNCLVQGYQMRTGKGGSEIATATEQAMAVQPNPATESVTVVLQLSASGTFRFLTPDGKTVWQQTAQSPVSQLEVTLEAIPAGIYLVEFRGENGERLVSKLCVQ